MNVRTSKKGTATIDMGFIVNGREELHAFFISPPYQVFKITCSLVFKLNTVAVSEFRPSSFICANEAGVSFMNARLLPDAYRIKCNFIHVKRKI